MTHDSYRLLVAGAGGVVGTALVEYLADTDYSVRALTGSSENESLLRHRGADEVVVGDLFSPRDAAAAVDGVDGVLCAVRSRFRSQFLGRLVVGAGVRNLVDAADGAGVSYFVLLSTIGVGDSKESRSVPERLLYRRLLSTYDATERYLRDSGLPFTILRSGRLVRGEQTREVVAAEGGDTVSGRIRYADQAWLMVASLTTPEARNRTFEVVSGASTTADEETTVDFEWRGPETGLVATRSDYSIPS
ncbi:NAD(P)H-binding protein [Haloarchaeobius sp. HRN-SO-5]|uniref:NAD(P)H-binding protein n=1 Tax=Haloarchaeobius sp. HRN-SO-5 TaxID=3446118 RepID=UPI003EC08FB6